MAIKHSKVSAKADGADTSLVRPSDWNASHVIDAGSIVTADLADGAVTAAKLASGAAITNLFAGRRFTFTDDWMYVGPLYAHVTGYIGQALGHHTFTSQLTHTGASVIGITGTGRLGLVGMSTGSTAAGQCRLHTCAMGAFDAGGTANMSSISYEAVLAFEAQATVGEDFIAEIGLVGNAPGYGCFFRYQRSVGGNKWLAVTENLGTETVQVLDGSGGSVDAGTIQALSLPSFGMFRLKVVMDSPDGTAASATARFYVNGVLVWTTTSNLPTHSLAGSVEIVKAAGTTPRYLALDYTCLEYQFRLDRVP